MVSKNNHQFYQQKHAERKQRWGIRKLSVGVASVLLGTTFMLHSNRAVSADTVPTTTPTDDTVQADSNVADLQGPEVTLPTTAPAAATTTNAEEKVVATNTQDTTQDKDKQTNANETTQNTTNVGKKDTEVTLTNDETPNTTAKVTLVGQKKIAKVNALTAPTADPAETPDPTAPDNLANAAIINNQDELANDWMQLEQGKLKLYLTARGLDNKIYVSSYADAHKKNKSMIISNRLDPNSLEIHVDFENTDVKKNIATLFGWDTKVMQIDTSRLGTDGIVAYGKSGKKYQIGLNHDGGSYDYYERMVELGKDISQVGALYMTDPIEANDTISTIIPVKYIGNKKQTTSIFLTSYFNGYKSYPGLELEFRELHPAQIETPAKPTTDKDTVTTGIYNNPQITTSDWLKMVHGEAIAYYTAKGKDGKTYVTGYVAANGKSQSIINVKQIDLSTLEYHLIYHNGDKEDRSGLWANFADNKTIAIDTSRLGADGPQLKSQQGWSYKWAINGPKDGGNYYNSWAEYLKAHNNVGDQATNISMTGVAIKPDDMVEFVIPVKYIGQLSARTPSLTFAPHINDYGKGFTQNWADLYFTTVHKDLSEVKRVVLLPTEFMGEQSGESDWKLVKEISKKDMPNGWDAFKISNFPTYKGSFNMDSLPKGDLPSVVYGSAQYFIDLSKIQEIFANHGYTVKYANNNGKAQEMPFYAYATLPLAKRVDDDRPVYNDPSIWVIHVQAVPAIILNKDQHYVADPNAKPWDTTSMIDEIYAADDAGQRKTRDQLEKLPKTDVDISYEYQAPGVATAAAVDKVDLTKAGVYTVTYSHTYANKQVVKDSRKVYVDEVKQETKDITRTIIVHAPNGTDQTVTQKATLTREVIRDATTGEIKSVGKWSTAKWEAYSAPKFEGYTPDKAQIDETIVNGDTKDATVEISYTANKQTGKIIYQDVNDRNAKVGQTDLSAQTGETVMITPHAPAGYDIVPGQTIPATETATANGIPDVIVKVSHHQIPVTPSQEPKPGDKMPGNPDKKPGDGTPKTDITYNDLHKAMTRTVNVNDPHDGLKTTTETLNYERTATIDDVTGNVAYGQWTVAPGSQAGFDNFAIPAVPGYTAKITSGTADELKAITPSQDQINNWTDETIDIDYTANDQLMTIDYVDKDDNPVDGGTFHVSGKTDQTVDTNAKIPTGWVLVPGQTDAPKTITFTGTPTANIKITIEHGTQNVPHNNPVKPGAKTPTGKPINGAHKRDLNQTITRTIIIHEPGKDTQTITQEAHIYRDATYDDVTGEITYGDWSQDDKAWAEFDAPTVDGYTANQTKVDAVTVKNGQKNVSVDITYDANDQTQLINYVDDSGKIVKTTTIPGKTAQTVDIPLQVPEHYDIVPGQNIPKQVTLITDNLPINVKITPKLDPVTDPAQLNKTITRTITINKPGAKPQIIKQTAMFTRTGETNEVTGKTTFTAWTVAANGWTEVDAPAVPGYTPDKSKIDAVNVTAEMTDTSETINYLTNAQTGKIVYVDKDGDEVSHTDLTGKTGAVITITPQAPIDWKIVPGQSIPKTVTAGSDGIPTVKIVVEHDTITVTPDQPKNPSDKLPDGKSYPEGVTAADLNKTVTRTITINVPNKAPQVIVQKAAFSQTATIDLVSHAVTYSNWKAGQNGWTEVTAPTVPGYTPDQAIVPADSTVTVDTEDSQVTIDYTANAQTQVVNYVDPDGNTIKSDAIPGHTDETVAIDVDVPEHYDIVPGQNIPKQVTLITDNLPINVKITPKLDPVTDPAQLNKTITRTIAINKPGEAPQVITQQATFTRTGKHNEATATTIFTPWMLKDNSLVAVNAPAVDGYMPSQDKVAGIEDPTVDTKLTDVEITYTANDQLIHIVYKDEVGNTVKTDLVSGKTDQTVDVHSTVPAGWQLADGQSVPKTVTFKAAGNKDAVVIIEHNIVPVSHTDPLPDGEKTPTGEPINGAHDSDLNQTITRTINVTTPNGKTTTIKQVAHIYRDAAYDDVTGEVTYGAWSTDPAAWQGYTPAEITGYTPSLNAVPAVTVTDGQKNVTIDITYAANTQPSGEPTQPSGEPTQPTGNQPTQPSGQSTSPAGSLTPLKPATPDHSETADQPAAPVHGAGAAELNTGHIANDNSISSQLTHYANGAHKHTDQLPQTGNDEHKKASALGFIFATLASLFGMAGFKKKKKDEQ